MNNSLFCLLSQMDGAEIAKKLCAFLCDYEFLSTLPSDEDILCEIADETTAMDVANVINSIAIERVKAYLELNLVDVKHREKLEELLHYEEYLDSADSKKSYFNVIFFFIRLENPGKEELDFLVNLIKQYEISVLEDHVSQV